MNESSEIPATQPPLAVVGLSALFPKAASVDEFWSNIRRGVDAITEVPDTHWNPDDYFDANQKTPDMTYARRGGFLSPVPFDPLEFGISPNNLEAIDTSQLLGMVGAKRALEHAGYGSGRTFDRSRVGCILGVTGTLEMVIPLGARLGHPRWRKALKDAGVPDDVAEDVVNRISHSYVPWQENSFPGLLGNVVAGRIANRLDLHGTNCVVDAACASSLSAIHLAALELWTGRSDMVVTGGIDTFNDIFMFMCFSKTPALSPSGDSKPFSDEADGTILGEGVGMLVLKRLSDAQRDGDRVFAVLKGIGTSSDGAGNAVYAPKAEGQIRCLEDAYRVAGVSPDTIELVEAHGTGTKVGDATEVSGLMQVYKATGRRGAWCAVGSVKSQIGHTKAAAGAAGVIKAILALQHRVLPPTIKVNQPPAAILAEDSPFYVNTEARPWLKPRGYPRRAAVSAFGFGGSNFHCVLEESPQRFDEPDWDGNVQVIALSADSILGLSETIRTSMSPLAGSEWRDVRAFAALSRNQFRVEHPHRLLFTIERDKTDLAKIVGGALTMLERYPDKPSWTTPDGTYYGRGERQGKLGVLFPGQGAQYVGMLRELVCRFPSMSEVLDEANEVFSTSSPEIATNHRLSDFIYPHPSFAAEIRELQETELRATQVAQPAIGAISLAVLTVLDQFGIQPEAVAGHSYGELTALCASRRFSPQVLYRLSSLRGRLMAAAQQTDGGMLAVLAPLTQIEAALHEMSLDLVVANHNSPTQVVLSGRIPDIDQAASLFASRNIRGKKLPVAAAFHSPLVAAASSEFRPVLDDVDFSPSVMPVYANSTATEYPAEPEAARDLLANQLARPVHFVHEIEQMYADGVRTFLEVGPGGVLTGLVNSILDGRDYRAMAIDSSNGKRSGLFDLASAFASLAASGYAIRWDQWDPQAKVTTEQAGQTRLLIPICGANYVKPRTPIPPRPLMELPPSAVRMSTDLKAERTDEPESNPGGSIMTEAAADIIQTPLTSMLTETIPTMPTKNPNVGKPTDQITFSGISKAGHVEAIREALLALQRMQQETSRLHQQFLEEQAAAMQTLSRLAGNQFGSQDIESLAPAIPVSTYSSYPETQQHFDHSGFESSDSQLHDDSVSATEPFEPLSATDQADWSSSHYQLPVFSTTEGFVSDSATETSLTEEPETSSPAEAPLHFSDRPAEGSPQESPLAATVLAVVSEKTGYPIEMLNLDMSLDHDLGIDSIKRVEILSALQERVENLPAFQPEELGALHTLRDVVAIADARSEAATINVAVRSVSSLPEQDHVDLANSSTPQPSGTSKPNPAEATAAGPSLLGTTVLAVVSEKTGYPIEMLNLNMSLDHDLGIDSIKRVEILSALQERVENLPAFQPEELGALHTLRDVVAIADARAGAPSIKAAAESASLAPESNQLAGRVLPMTASNSSTEPSHSERTAVNPSSLGAIVLAVVSEKTGYPIEMLNLDMSLDHDLGIDSIKRVEILSALQEKVPNLPAFQPEELGALHTLKDVVNIADARSAASPAKLAQSPATVESKPKTAQPAPVAHNLRALNESTRGPVVAATLKASAPQLQTQQLKLKPSQLSETVLTVVSEKTGYPIEMLNLNMSLDHDLGIDSIKRVEILSALQERVPQLPAFQPEELGSLHTLQDVVTLADARTASARTASIPAPARTPTVTNQPVIPRREGIEIASTIQSAKTNTAKPISPPELTSAQASRGSSKSSITRSIVRPVAIPPAATRPPIKLFPGSEIWITEDGLGLSLLVADELTERGFKPRIVNLDEPHTAVVPSRLAGLIIIAPQRDMDEHQLWNAVEWLKKAGPTLRQVGSSSRAILATVSRLDGRFGFESTRLLKDPVSGGLAGIAKCADLEWSEVTSRAFDLSYEWSAPHVAAAMLVTELLHEGPNEVGLMSSGPHTLAVIDEALTPQNESPPIKPGEVLVVSGGARGVTAETVFAVARAWRPRLVILGRSPEPAPEPEWLMSLTAEAEIKQALIARAPAGTTPKAISHQYQEIAAGREVSKQLQRIRSTGVSVIYHSVDVRNPTAVRPLLAAIRRDLGVVRGIIHGAGVLADQRIEDKSKDQFDRVYGTKVAGLKSLLDCVDPNELRLLGLFSSYTARFGRIGQLDYAIANEVLNKQARQFSILHPNCRVAAFNWGPWDGGMVQGGLKKLFASEGVGLIPTESGAEALVHEFNQMVSRPVEVLILANQKPFSSSPGVSNSHVREAGSNRIPMVAVTSNGSHFTQSPSNLEKSAVKQSDSARIVVPVNSSTSAGRTGSQVEAVTHDIHDRAQLDVPVGYKLAFERELDVANYSFLESHVLGGKAVLPVAMIFEWLAHGAIHGNPGLELRGFDDFRVFQGVRLGGHDRVHLRILSGKPAREESHYKVPMRLIGHLNGRDVIHAGGSVVLSPGYPSAPAPMIHVPMLRPYSMDVADAYATRLFHGPKLRGIMSIEGCSEDGIVVMSRLAPVASAWMTEPVRANWLADPLAIDSALQAVILWSQEMRGKPCLPCAVTKYRQFRRALPHSGVRIIIRVQPATEQLIRCEVEFVDLQGLLIARMEGCESVVDASLSAAFQKNRIVK